jgi:hypothetical protein
MCWALSGEITAGRGVAVGVAVRDGVNVGVAVGVAVGVRVGVGVLVRVAVGGGASPAQPVRLNAAAKSKAFSQFVWVRSTSGA